MSTPDTGASTSTRASAPSSATGNDPIARAQYLADAIDVARGLGIALADVIAADAVLLQARVLRLEAHRLNRLP
jgi:hypothetical protein